MEDNDKLLVVIFDVNPYLWSKRRDEFKTCIDSLMVFCNSYLMFNHSNKLAFFVCDSKSATMLYPPPIQEEHENEAGGTTDGKFELFADLNSIITNHLKVIIDEYDDERADNKHATLLSGAFSQALCYIHKKTGEERGQRLNSRIFVLKMSPDESSLYMSVMNCIFASQKHNIVVDTCSLYTKSGYLQQAADITSGIYNHVDDVSGLLELLLWMYLPDAEFRERLHLPSSIEIDYRAACFCHKRLVEVGFVCSVCLSIYCQFMPKCLTCQTRFKLPQLPPMKPRKKKKVN